MAGARTIAGALVPLVGAAPTNFNFVAGDYNRKTGLQGDGSTKYLDSNRNNNADPQNSKHISAYVTIESLPGTPGIALGTNTVASGGSWAGRNADRTTSAMRANSATSYSYLDAWPLTPGLIGVSRSGANAQSHFAGPGLQTSTIASDTPLNENILIFAGVGGISSNTQSFYSIGESLDLALLDARVTALMGAFAAVIP